MCRSHLVGQPYSSPNGLKTRIIFKSWPSNLIEVQVLQNPMCIFLKKKDIHAGLGRQCHIFYLQNKTNTINKVNSKEEMANWPPENEAYFRVPTPNKVTIDKVLLQVIRVCSREIKILPFVYRRISTQSWRTPGPKYRSSGCLVCLQNPTLTSQSESCRNTMYVCSF